MTIKKHLEKVSVIDKFIPIYNSANIASFKGRVYYANKTAKDYAPKYRDIIHKLNTIQPIMKIKSLL